MSDNLIEVTPSAYEFPLLIKHLLHAPLTRSSEQVIVYRERRHTYRQFRDRLGRLASALTDLGVKAGDVVAVLDWDSHRYHECYFAIPMMGAVLQTGNLALPPEQLLYTLNDTGATTLLLNVDFLPLIEPLAARLPKVSRYILLNDWPVLPTTMLPVAGEYEALIEFELAVLRLPRLRREEARNDLPHHRHYRAAEGRVFQPSPDPAARLLYFSRIRRCDGTGTAASR